MKKMQIKYGLRSTDQEAQACSGAVRVEQCEYRAAGERGGGTIMFRHGTG